MSKQHLLNNEFSDGLSGWIDESSHLATAQIEQRNGNKRARLQPTAEGTARITQRIAVEGNTKYQLSGNIFSEGSSYGYIGIKGFDGKWSEKSTGDNASGEHIIIFTTSAKTEFIDVFAEAYKQQIDPIMIDDFSLIPITDSSPIEPSEDDDDKVLDENKSELEESNDESADIAAPSVNLVKQGQFEGVFYDEWTLSGGVDFVEIDGNKVLKLTATGDTAAKALQRIKGLKPETLYTFSARILTNKNSWASFGIDQGTQHATETGA